MCFCPQPSTSEITPLTVSELRGNTRQLRFVAEFNGQPATASCQISGPTISEAFTTPAELNVPLTNNGRADVSDLSCQLNGITLSATGIPGEGTRIIKLDYDRGFADIWFQRQNESVLYLINDGKLITVSGSPAP